MIAQNTCPSDHPGDVAVSAVISVILMVAITVIVAAIVAVYAFGFAEEIPATRMLTSTISHVDANHVTVTYQGGQDQYACVGIRWDMTSVSGSSLMSTMMGSASPSASLLTVGTAKTLTTSYSGKKHVVGTAFFKDNSQQVIFDSWVG